MTICKSTGSYKGHKQKHRCGQVRYSMDPLVPKRLIITRKVSRHKPAAGICSRCGGGASVADMKTSTRFCYVPFYWKSWRAIMCTFCGAILRSYR
ncbi:unnamed protein product [Ilex paraguariensis]|uniref:Uncharacterized protein n=1 Tax=Ilex paraguariensis TaxID=185542 RepID=A0ABC8SP08_9AQUA